MLNKDVDHCIRKFSSIKFRKTFRDPREVNKEREDFYQEAWLTASKAIEAYSDNKDTKLTTFVTRCVLNRFSDLGRMANRKLKYHNSGEEELPSPRFSPWERIDLNLCLKQLLDDFDYFIFRAKSESYSYKEISKLIKDEFNKEMTSQEVQRCFSHIMQTLESNGMSL